MNEETSSSVPVNEPYFSFSLNYDFTDEDMIRIRGCRDHPVEHWILNFQDDALHCRNRLSNQWMFTMSFIKTRAYELIITTDPTRIGCNHEMNNTNFAIRLTRRMICATWHNFPTIKSQSQKFQFNPYRTAQFLPHIICCLIGPLFTMLACQLYYPEYIGKCKPDTFNRLQIMFSLKYHSPIYILYWFSFIGILADLESFSTSFLHHWIQILGIGFMIELLYITTSLHFYEIDHQFLFILIPIALLLTQLHLVHKSSETIVQFNKKLTKSCLLAVLLITLSSIPLAMLGISTYADRLVPVTAFGILCMLTPISSLLFSIHFYSIFLTSCSSTPAGPIAATLGPSLFLYITERYIHSGPEIEAMYMALPTTPSCYIATAAARGHRRIVGGMKELPGVNRQLLICKLAELVLKQRSPGIHRRIRGAYDKIGPSLARRIRNPWLADLAWLAILPFSLSAELVLALQLGRKNLDHILKQARSSAVSRNQADCNSL